MTEVGATALQLTRDADVFDLHIDTFIPRRLWGYDPRRRHGPGLFRGRFFGHLDLPRIQDACLDGAMWSITTQPFRSARRRWAVFCENLRSLRDLADQSDGTMRIVTNHAEYIQARRDGVHACLPSIQGGHAIAGAPDGPASIPDRTITRITLVHLTNSCYGATSSPFRFWANPGLTDLGRKFIEQLNAERILVDLAHIAPRAFWDAVAVHDDTQPLIATHTGVSGVTPHWRNLDDDQLRAIADTGGTVGVIFHQGFLRRPGGPRDVRMVLEHVAHIVDTVGEDHASLGSDYDGLITPPPDLRRVPAYARLTQAMLDRGWQEPRIRKILGGNALRALSMIRPG